MSMQGLYDPVRTIAGYTLVEALRNRLAWLLVAVLIGGFGLAEFTGALAITESQPIKAALLASLLRLFAVFIVSLFVITSVVREFNDKTIELVWSLPVQRSGYFLGKLAGFSLLALLMGVLCGALLLLYAPVVPVLVWCASLFCELLLVAALSLLCLFTFTQILPAMTAVAAFYLLARSMAAIQLIAGNPISMPDAFSQQFISGFIRLIAFLLPSLDRFTLSAWLVYPAGAWEVLAPVVGQTCVYLVLITGAALFDLHRREL